MGLIVLINLALTAVAVIIYLDATKQKIGKIEGERSLLNISAGAWGFCTIAIAILAIPLYLINREKLIEKAKKLPVELSLRHRVIVSLVLVALGLASLFMQTLHSGPKG